MPEVTECGMRSAEKLSFFRPEVRPYSGPLPEREHERVALSVESLAAVLSAKTEKTERQFA